MYFLQITGLTFRQFRFSKERTLKSDVLCFNKPHRAVCSWPWYKINVTQKYKWSVHMFQSNVSEVVYWIKLLKKRLETQLR